MPGVPARTWVYNDRGQLVSETQPESGTTTYTYDAAGNRASRTDALGVTTLFGTTRATGCGRSIRRGRPTTSRSRSIRPTVGSPRRPPRPSRRRSATITPVALPRGPTPAGPTRLRRRTPTMPTICCGRSRTLGARHRLRLRPRSTGCTTVSNNAAVFADAFVYGDTGALASFRTGAVTHTVAYDSRDRVTRLTALNTGGAGLDCDVRVRPRQPGAPDCGSAAWRLPVLRLRRAGPPLDRHGAMGHVELDLHGRGRSGLGGRRRPHHVPVRIRSRGGSRPRRALCRTRSPTTPSADSRRMGAGSYQYTRRGLLSQFTSGTVTATNSYDAAGGRIAHTVNGVTTFSVSDAANQILSEYEVLCGAQVWKDDLVYAAGRPAGCGTERPSNGHRVARGIHGDRRRVGGQQHRHLRLDDLEWRSPRVSRHRVVPGRSRAPPRPGSTSHPGMAT